MLLGVLAVIGLFVGFAAGCVAAIDSVVAAPPVPVPIRYEVTGTGGEALITWSTDAGTGQASAAALPWSRSVTFQAHPMSSAIVTLTAQRGPGTGSVVCRVIDERNDAVVIEQRSDGPHAIASCSGSVKVEK
jgi:hypothetical protein